MGLLQEGDETRSLARRVIETGHSVLTSEQIGEAVGLLYAQIGPVNNLLTHRFTQELELGAPPPLTADNIHLVDIESFAEIIENYDTAHPLWQAAENESRTLRGYHPDYSDTVAVYQGNEVYWNMNGWLVDLEKWDEKGIERFKVVTQENLYHEQLHLLSEPRMVEGAGKRILAQAVLGKMTLQFLKTVETHGIDRTPHMQNYLSFLAQVIHSGEYELQVRGGIVRIFHDGKLLANGGTFVNESIVYYETAKLFDQDVLDGVYSVSIDEIPTEFQQLVQAYRDVYDPVRVWENAVGEKDLLDSFINGKIYDVILQAEKPDNPFDRLVELMVKPYPLEGLEILG